MKDVSLLEVRQIRIYPSDRVPFVQIVAPLVAQAFAKRLGGAEIVPGPAELGLVGASFTSATDKALHIIKLLQIADRKIVLIVDGPSSVANEAYALVIEAMAEVASAPGEPLLLTEETSCVATLDFDWSDLMAPSLHDLVAGRMLGALTTMGTKPEVLALGLSLRFTYPEVAASLRQHGVTLADKSLTIEPRRQTPLADRRYFTSSPTGSEGHFGLLRDIEHALAAARPRSG